jgi:ubiquitin C-terminal hydrolase
LFFFFVVSFLLFFIKKKKKLRISKLSSRFEGYDQQDSHEFLVYLLDGLHEELKTKTNYQTSFKEIIVPNNKIDAEFQRLSSSLWKSYLNNNSSKISLLFHFMICSINICLSCNYASLKFDPTSFITLPISDSKKVCKKFNFIFIFLKKKNSYK